jgi:hypothetical protein
MGDIAVTLRRGQTRQIPAVSRRSQQRHADLVKATRAALSRLGMTFQVRKNLFEGNRPQLILDNLEHIENMAALVPGNWKSVFINWALADIIGIAEQEGFEPFVEIAKAVKGESIYSVFSRIGEIGKLGYNHGANAFAQIAREHSSSISLIFRSILGDRFGRPDGTTNYKGHLVDLIESKEELVELADNLSKMFEIHPPLEALDEYSANSGVLRRLVKNYGIGNLPYIARLAKLTEAYFKPGPGYDANKTVLECYLEALKTACSKFGWEAIIQLLEEKEDLASDLIKEIRVLAEELDSFDEFSEYFSTIRTIVDNAKQSFFDLHFNPLNFDNGLAGELLFDTDSRLKVVSQRYGLEALVNISERWKNKTSDIFKNLHKVESLHNSKKELFACTEGLGHLAQAKLPLELALKIPGCDKSSNNFQRVCRQIFETVRILENIFGKTKRREKFEEAKKEIETLGDLETICFDQEEVLLLIMNYGFPIVARALGKTEHSSEILDSLAHVADIAIKSQGYLFDVCSILKEQAEKNPLFLEIVLPEIALNLKTPRDLRRHAIAVAKVHRICSSEKVARETLEEMAEVHPLSRTPKAWRHFGEVWARISEDRNDDASTLPELYFGESSKEMEQNKTIRHVVLKNARAYGITLKVADRGYRSDSEIVLAALESWVGAYRIADDELKNDLNFNNRAFNLNFNCVPHMPRATSRMKKAYRRLVQRLTSLNISFPERFNTQTALEILRNRQNIAQNDGRPFLLMVFPKKDHNKAFCQNQIATFIKAGYKVLYFEIANAKDLAAVKVELRAAGLEAKIRLLELGAHSTITHMAFGAEDPAIHELEKSDYYFSAFTPNEGIGKELSGLAEFLSPGCPILVNGCAVAGGRGRNVSVLTRLAEMFPQSSVHGPTLSTGAEQTILGENGKYQRTIYPNGDIEYTIRPKVA